MEIRELERPEIRDVWSIDRAEVIDRVSVRDGDRLVLRPEHHDVRGWPPDLELDLEPDPVQGIAPVGE